MTDEHFSARAREEEPDIEVGHVAGLRWLTLDAPCDDRWARVTMTGAGSGTLMTCTCGASIRYVYTGEAETWIGAHRGDGTPRFPVLSGVYGPWVPGENTAACLSSPSALIPAHTSPQIDSPCHCGFWNYWALGAKAVARNPVVGLVKGYGHVLEGDRGWRSSHAAIEALCIPSPDPALLNAVEDRYQVPVYSTVGAMLSMHPAPPGQPELSDGGWSADLSAPPARYSVNYPYSYYVGGAGPSYSAGPFYGGGGGGGYSIPLVSSGGGGGSTGWNGIRPGETVHAYAQRIGLASPPAVQGGRQGGKSAAVTKAAAAEADRPARMLGKLGEAASTAAKAIRGMSLGFTITDEAVSDKSHLPAPDAVKALHDRREKWAGFRSARNPVAEDAITDAVSRPPAS